MYEKRTASIPFLILRAIIWCALRSEKYGTFRQSRTHHNDQGKASLTFSSLTFSVDASFVTEMRNIKEGSMGITTLIHLQTPSTSLS